jgi:hypothetical protein
MNSYRDAKSAAGFFTSVVGRLLGSTPAPTPVIDKRTQNLERKKMNIRAAGVREGFQAMRARSEVMAQRLETFKKQRHPDPTISIDPVEQVETIVLSSTFPLRRAQRDA